MTTTSAQRAYSSIDATLELDGAAVDAADLARGRRFLIIDPCGPPYERTTGSDGREHALTVRHDPRRGASITVRRASAANHALANAHKDGGGLTMRVTGKDGAVLIDGTAYVDDWDDLPGGVERVWRIMIVLENSN